MTPTRQIHISHERGSAIFMILIGIALFAALSYTVGNMMRSGDAQAVPEEKAKVYAAQLVDYGNTIRQAVQNIRIDGCEETEISFTRESGDDYEHSPSVPAKCQVFNATGGGAKYQLPPAEIYDGSDYIFTGEHAAENIGTVCTNADCSDLIMVLENLDKAVCLAINERLGINNPSNDAPNDAGGAMSPFVGSYAYENVLLDEDTELDGQTAGCFRDTPANTYSYFKVLLAR